MNPLVLCSLDSVVSLSESTLASVAVSFDELNHGSLLCCGTGLAEAVTSCHFCNITSRQAGSHSLWKSLPSFIESSLLSDCEIHSVSNVFYCGLVHGVCSANFLVSRNNTNKKCIRSISNALHEEQVIPSGSTKYEFVGDEFLGCQTQSLEVGEAFNATTCGGSLFLTGQPSSTLLLERCVFNNSRCGSRAGAVYVEGITDAVCVGCAFLNCSSCQGDGGSLYFRDTRRCTYVAHALCDSCSAPRIAGFWIAGSSLMPNSGPCYTSPFPPSPQAHFARDFTPLKDNAEDMAKAFLHNCTFTNNVVRAGEGGGLALDFNKAGFVRNVLCIHNTASGRGGGVYLYTKLYPVADDADDVLFFFCLFHGNRGSNARDAYIISTQLRWDGESATRSPFCECSSTTRSNRVYYTNGTTIWEPTWLTRTSGNRRVAAKENENASDASVFCGISEMTEIPCATIRFAVSESVLSEEFTITAEQGEHEMSLDEITIPSGVEATIEGAGRKQSVSSIRLTGSAFESLSSEADAKLNGDWTVIKTVSSESGSCSSLFTLSAGKLTIQHLDILHTVSDLRSQSISFAAVRHQSSVLSVNSVGISGSASGGNKLTGRLPLFIGTAGTVRLSEVEVTTFTFSEASFFSFSGAFASAEMTHSNVSNLTSISGNPAFGSSTSGSVRFLNVSVQCCSAPHSTNGGALSGTVPSSNRFELSNCSLAYCSASDSTGRGGALHLTLSATSSVCSLSNLNFRNNTAPFGRDIYLIAPDLQTVVNRASFAFALELNDTEGALAGNDYRVFKTAAFPNGEDLFFFLTEYHGEEISVGSGRQDTIYCGKPIVPCKTPLFAIGHFPSDSERKMLMVEPSVDLNEVLDLSGVTVQPSSSSSQVQSPATLSIASGLSGDQSCGILNEDSTLIFDRIAFLFGKALGKAVLIRSLSTDGHEALLQMKECSFKRTLDEGSNEVSFSLVEVTSGAAVFADCKVVSPRKMAFTNGCDFLIVGFAFQTISLTDLQFENLTFGAGSVIKLDDSTSFFFAQSLFPGKEKVKRNELDTTNHLIALTRCVFTSITGVADKPCVFYCGSITSTRSVEMRTVSLRDCVSSESKKGGAIRFDFGLGSRFHIEKSKLHTCVGSIVSGGDGNEGRGGGIYMTYSGNGQSLAPLLFSDVTFTKDNATIARDLYLSCTSLANEISPAQFDLDLRSHVFVRENAFYGSSQDTQGDVDLLDHMDRYQSETIFVSSLAPPSPTVNLCGTEDQPCPSFSVGLTHLVNDGYEKRLVIKDAIRLEEAIALKAVSLKSLLNQTAVAIISPSSASRSDQGSLMSWSGVCDVNGIRFEFASGLNTELKVFMTIAGVMSISDCSFCSVLETDVTTASNPLVKSESTVLPTTATTSLPYSLISIVGGSLVMRDVEMRSIHFLSGTSALSLQSSEIVLRNSNFSSLISDSSSLISDQSSSLPSRFTAQLIVFDSIVRSDPGPTILHLSHTSFLHSRDCNFSCSSSGNDCGNLVDIEHCEACFFEYCSFFGQIWTRDANSDICTWDGSLLSLFDSVGTMSDVTIMNSSKGGLLISEGAFTIAKGAFENNNPNFPQFASVRRNLLCLAEEGETVVNVSSLKGGDGYTNGSSLWIKSSADCTVGGLASERASPFFVPTLSNATMKQAEQTYSLTLEGTLLLPCGTQIGVVVLDDQGERLSTRSYPFSTQSNESVATGEIPRTGIDDNFGKNDIGVVVLFGAEDDSPSSVLDFKETSVVLVAQRTKRNENEGIPLVAGGNERTISFIVVLCILGLINVVISVLFVLLFVRLRREKEKRKQPVMFVKDVEMQPHQSSLDSAPPTKAASEQRHSLYSNEEAKSTDSLLRADEKPAEQLSDLPNDTEVLCDKQEAEKKEVEEQESGTSVVRHVEPIPTTSSVDNLVEGMCCEAPFEKNIVDTRDSLFERLHHSKDPKEKLISIQDRITRACRTLFWVANGLEHVLESSKAVEILKELSSHCIMFGEDGAVYIARVPAKLIRGKECSTPETRILKSDCADLKKGGNVCRDNTRWKAPELLSDDSFSGDQFSAVFSIGMLLYELITGEVPFEGLDEMSAGLKIMNGEHPSLPQTVGRSLAGLYLSCVKLHPHDRPTLDEVKKHLLVHLPEGRGEVGQGDGFEMRGEDGEGNGGVPLGEILTPVENVANGQVTPVLRQEGKEAKLVCERTSCSPTSVVKAKQHLSPKTQPEQLQDRTYTLQTTVTPSRTVDPLNRHKHPHRLAPSIPSSSSAPATRTTPP